MRSMSLKPLSTRRIEVTNARCRLANARIDICESDLLLLPGWQDVIMRFLFKSNDASTLREAKFRESLESAIEESMEVNEVRSVAWERICKKIFNRSSEKCRTNTRYGDIFSKNATINILRDSTVVFKIL